MSAAAIPDSYAALAPDTARTLFAAGEHAVPVLLQRLPGARVLWLNQRAMSADPAFARLGGDVAAYRAHLLASCAYAIGGGGDGVTGHADRYGGAGIGRNGGSGRAAVVNGYHVKGVGRTPLVGAQTDSAHASGGAYLEESVRETIFSELLAAEFPHATIPTLAIIDTGLVQPWPQDREKPSERRVLLVRPCMLRPAHFERADGYQGPTPTEGARDMARVRHTFGAMAARGGADGLALAYRQLLVRWAEQLAYAQAHRLSVGGHSTSNICMDGSLLDFGACSALPSWSEITLVPGAPPTGSEFTALLQAAQSLAYYFGRGLPAPVFGAAEAEAALGLAWQAYAAMLAGEVLRLCGLPRALAQAALAGPRQAGMLAVIGRLLGHYRKEQYDILDFTPSPRLPWDLADIWLPLPPPHLASLRAELDTLAPADMRAGMRAQCRFISRSRPRLYREELKRRLYRRLERGGERGGERGAAEDEAIATLIASEVAHGRRDPQDPPHGAVAAGFAACARGALTLYRGAAGGGLFAVVDWLAPALRREAALSGARLACRVAHDGLYLGPGGGYFLPCAVAAQAGGGECGGECGGPAPAREAQ